MTHSVPTTRHVVVREGKRESARIVHCDSDLSGYVFWRLCPELEETMEEWVPAEHLSWYLINGDKR